MADIILVPLSTSDREQFILDNQEAFNYGAQEEFGLRDEHFEEDGQIISRETIEQSIMRMSRRSHSIWTTILQVDVRQNPSRSSSEDATGSAMNRRRSAKTAMII